MSCAGIAQDKKSCRAFSKTLKDIRTPRTLADRMQIIILKYLIYRY